MAKPVVMQFNADIERSMNALAAVISRLGYTLKSVDKENCLITFETGISTLSWAGQNLSIQVIEMDGAVQITVGGTMKAHGATLHI